MEQAAAGNVNVAQFSVMRLGLPVSDAVVTVTVLDVDGNSLGTIVPSPIGNGLYEANLPAVVAGCYYRLEMTATATDSKVGTGTISIKAV